MFRHVSPMTILWQWKVHFGLKIFSLRQAEAAALQTSLGRPDLSTIMAMRHSWLLLVQVGCSVVMTQKTTALHMKNPCQGYHLHFWAGLKKLTLPKCLEGLKPLFSQKQEDNDGITDTRKTSTTVWDWGVEEAFQPAVFKLLYRGFFKAPCARRTCYNSPTNILRNAFVNAT